MCCLSEIEGAVQRVHVFSLDTEAVSKRAGGSTFQLLDDIKFLSDSVDDAECWGVDNDFSAVDVERFERVSAVLTRLTQGCLRGQQLSEVLHGDTLVIDDKTVDYEFQQLLEAHAVHNSCIAICEFQDEHERGKQRIVELQGLGIELLTACVVGNEQLQYELARDLDPIITVLKRGVEQALVLLVELARENRRVCDLFTTAQIEAVLTQFDARDNVFAGAVLKFVLMLCRPYGTMVRHLRDKVVPVLVAFASKRIRHSAPGDIVAPLNILVIGALAEIAQSLAGASNLRLRSLLPIQALVDALTQFVADVSMPHSHSKLAIVSFLRNVFFDTGYAMSAGRTSKRSRIRWAEHDPKIIEFMRILMNLGLPRPLYPSYRTFASYQGQCGTTAYIFQSFGA
eukprot:g184.t1